MTEKKEPPRTCHTDDRIRPGRRAFLQTAGCFTATLAVLGIGDAAAASLPVFNIEPAEQGTAEKRYPIPTSDSVNIDRGSSLIVARYHNQVMVFSLACPHENAPVRWLPHDNRFQCTKHDSRYDPDGVHIAGRATRNLDRYALARDGNNVVVDLHKWVRSDQNPSGWAAAMLAV